ncbi:MAG TPA: hypothetical protein VIM79_23940 [Niastella sp.]
MIKKISIVLTGCIFLFCSCYNDKEEILYGASSCDGINASYSASISQIIQTNCAVSGCHADGSTNGPGALTSYDKIRNAAVDIKSAVVTGLMPQGGKLTSTQIRTISCWVDHGAANN